MRLARLDGLRAVAIAGVVLSHHALLTWGWMGVDLFFVLSGFLITAILRRDREHPAYWQMFYAKRFTRILPPALLFIAISAFIERSRLVALLPYIFFMGNIAGASKSGGVYRLNILWSLAVEEHFYLFFPFAVRYLRREALIRLLVGIVLIEPLVRAVATHHVQSYVPIYFLTIFRLDGLAMGALLALALEERATAQRVGRYAGYLAVGACFVYGVFAMLDPRFDRELNSVTFNAIGYTLIALASVGALAYVNDRPNSWVSRTLTVRYVVSLGLISYSLYLFHSPVVLFMKHHLGWSYQALSIASIPTACILSWLVYRFVELPSISFGHRIASRFRTGTSHAAAESCRRTL